MTVARATPKHPTLIWAVAFSPDSKMLAVGYGTEKGDDSPRTYGGVKIWDVATGQLLKELD